MRVHPRLASRMEPAPHGNQNYTSVPQGMQVPFLGRAECSAGPRSRPATLTDPFAMKSAAW